MKPLLKSNTRTVARYLLIFIFSALLIAGCTSGNTDGKIPLDEARARTQVIPVKEGQTYQDTFISARKELKELLKDSSFLDRKFRLPNAEAFNRDAIALLLNVQGADGIRVYLASDANGEQKFVLVPIDKNGKDIITNLLTGGTNYETGKDSGQVVENGQICPPCQIGQ